MKEFIDKIGTSERNKLTLYKASSKIHFWYEDSEKWFINIRTDKEKNSVWITANELEKVLTFYVNKKYKMKS